ncbi:hypothetical protein C2G38_53719 [Gigaspora rosea]|uniref:Uncharacterized protein n=1 Tax=Gigaspora rosea TaxID=44941 RepID=A0A397UTL4_9GLOM|nr:hypothetical protein C2G38_53719 [Gigaspora rosea]
MHVTGNNTDTVFFFFSTNLTNLTNKVHECVSRSSWIMPLLSLQLSIKETCLERIHTYIVFIFVHFAFIHFTSHSFTLHFIHFAFYSLFILFTLHLSTFHFIHFAFIHFAFINFAFIHFASHSFTLHLFTLHLSSLKRKKNPNICMDVLKKKLQELILVY